MKILRKYLTVVFSVACISLGLAAPTLAEDLRGTERSEAYLGDTERSLLTKALYLPRQVTDLGLKGIAKTAGFLSDPDVIEKIKDILYLYKRELVWFPLVEASSGYRPSYGAGLYYHHENIKSLFRGTVHDAQYYSLSWKGSYTHQIGDMPLKLSALGVLEKQDDLRYYGLGNDPMQDKRNNFIGADGQDYGIFSENRRKLQWGAELKPTSNWKVNITTVPSLPVRWSAEWVSTATTTST